MAEDLKDWISRPRKPISAEESRKAQQEIDQQRRKGDKS